MVALSALTYALLEWGGTWRASAWLHTAPYALLLLWCALGALAAAELSPWLLAAITIGQAAMFLWLWAAGVTLQSAYTSAVPGHPDSTLDALAAAALAGLAATAAAWAVLSRGR
jgi:small-conductance mechanosensitive channel